MLDIIDSIVKIFFPEKGQVVHENLAFVYSSEYNFRLEGHVFPAVKFEQMHELILMDEEFSKAEFFEPKEASIEDLSLVHTKEYLDDLLNCRWTELTNSSELPLNPQLVGAFRMGVGGTIRATELTSDFPFVFNIGGGFHHSFPNHAEGFCYLNDVAVAAQKHLSQNPNSKILIIDLDVHQGNGNSYIFKNNNNVYTFSMHQDNLYPKKELSDLDVGLPDYCNDTEYLSVLRAALKKISTEFQPDLIYYLAGADPFEDDRLGSLRLTMEGMKERDTIIKEFAIQTNSKVVILTAGGYARNTIDTVRIHLQTARVFHRK
jgi:acetoin utilization deacetylase AcuC-like enzyme